MLVVRRELVLELELLRWGLRVEEERKWRTRWWLVWVLVVMAKQLSYLAGMVVEGQAAHSGVRLAQARALARRSYCPAAADGRCKRVASDALDIAPRIACWDSDHGAALGGRAAIALTPNVRAKHIWQRRHRRRHDVSLFELGIEIPSLGRTGYCDWRTVHVHLPIPDLVEPRPC